jgi:cellobiose-specific phosphotransferase system component IIA
MSKATNDLERHLAIANETADQSGDTQSAVAKSETGASNGTISEMQRQMEAARERMKRYHNIYSKLAK